MGNIWHEATLNQRLVLGSEGGDTDQTFLQQTEF